MTEKSSGLSVVINNNGHISFNADLNYGVEQQEEEVTSVHVADVVYSVVLEALKKQVGNARLFPGTFRLLLTGCISDVSNTQEVVNAAEDDEEAPQTEESPVEETPEEETTEGEEAEEEPTE